MSDYSNSATKPIRACSQLEEVFPFWRKCGNSTLRANRHFSPKGGGGGDMGFWRIAWFSGGTERESVVASRVQSIKRTSADCQVTGNEVRPGKFYRDSWHNQIKITPGIIFLYFSAKRKRHTRSTSPAPGVERKEKRKEERTLWFRAPPGARNSHFTLA